MKKMKEVTIADLTAPDAVVDVSIETTTKLISEITALRAERDALRADMEATQAGIAAINKQNEELRYNNTQLGEMLTEVSQKNATYFATTPKLKPGLLVDRPIMVIDDNGAGFWINPEQRVLQKAW